MIALLAAAYAIPREDVLDNAAAFAAHVWTSTSANQYATCADGDYESDYPPGDYVGLPYDWGGYMSIDEFEGQLADGYGAGSHSWHGILECTAGLDCSGFVSKTWETGHYSTSTFDDGPTHEIALADLKRGDAVNDAGSHVVLYTYETDAGWPIYYEAAGGAQRVRLNTSGGWSYLDGYQPIRFDDIEDATATGTRGVPRDILAFPYTDFRWTAGAASDAIDAYSCSPDTDESGPEVMYRFEALSAGTLEVVVSDDDGTDVDIHVLTAADGDACLARNDTTISVEVEPGTIWIVADTWVGSQEFPGPYLLTATFDGRVGVPDGVDPVDTGDATDTDEPADTDVVDTDEPTDVGAERDLPRANRIAKEEPAGCVSAPFGASILGVLAGLFAIRRRR